MNTVFQIIFFPVLHRKVRWATLSAATVLMLWGSASARSALTSAASHAGRPLHQRAAFSWQEPFDRAFSNWLQPAALSHDATGAVRIQGLALHGPTMPLKNYAITFSARLQRKSIGWVVRAAAPNTYYAFKLTEKSRSAEGLKLELVRYAVTSGDPSSRTDRQIAPVVVKLPADGFLEITVNVAEDHILTMVNGFGVDHWKQPKVKSGGLGFLAEGGDSFLVRSLTITGNEDFLGLFLYGAEQTFRSVRHNLASLTASLQGFLT